MEANAIYYNQNMLQDLAWVGVFARSSVICVVCIHNSLCQVSSAFCFFYCKAIYIQSL